MKLFKIKWRDGTEKEISANSKLEIFGKVENFGSVVSCEEINKKVKLISKQETKTSRGMLSKGWYSINGKPYLVKGNSLDLNGVAYEPYSEVLVSRILKALGLCELEYYLGNKELFSEITAHKIKHVSVCESYAKDDVKITSFKKFVDTNFSKQTIYK